MQFKSEQDRKEILDCLSDNMNEEFRATLQYICHRISAKASHAVLSDSFKSAALDEMSHILFFSDLITKYGGAAQFTAWPIDRSEDVENMLREDIALERMARRRYADQLERFKDNPELAALLCSVLDDESDHEELFADYLKKL
jgi:bacterioferritin (cytochrome b1)